MQDLLRENGLLREYILTLEKENEARNIERSTIFQEIDRMSIEIDRLNRCLSKSKSQAKKTVNASNDRQLLALKQLNSSFSKQIENLKIKNSQLITDIMSKQNIIAAINQQAQALKLNLSKINQKSIQITIDSKKVLLLQQKVQNYEKKINQMTALHQSKILELQRQNKQIEDTIRFSKQKMQKVEEDVKRIAVQKEQLNINRSAEFSNMLNAKLALEATVKRLSSKIQWLQKNNSFQQQKINLNHRIAKLEAELKQASSYIVELQKIGITYKQIEKRQKQKDRQLEKLKQTIKNLKSQLYSLQQKEEEKEATIRKLNDCIKLMQQERKELDHQNNELQETKKYLSKELDACIKSKQYLESRVTDELQKEEKYLTQIKGLHGQRQKMVRLVENRSMILDESYPQRQFLKSEVTDLSFHQLESKRSPEKEINHNLHIIVSELQREVQALKESQLKSHPIQENTYNYGNISVRSPLARQGRSPINILSPPSATPKQYEKNSYNKNKWENLQRKINALRNENQTLKRNIFD